MLKAAGILCVILGASGAGFSMALGVRRSISVMQQLLAALEQMKSEMEYRKTPLPELMRVGGKRRGGLADFSGACRTTCTCGRRDRCMRLSAKISLRRRPASFRPRCGISY